VAGEPKRLDDRNIDGKVANSFQFKDEGCKKACSLLFLDNAPCHPHIRLFPANTTSITQPIDQGVIKNLKAWYRKFLIQTLLTKVDESQNVSELSKRITVLDAINWIAQACKKIFPKTIREYFAEAGFPIHENDESEPTVCPVNSSVSDIKCSLERFRIPLERIAFDDLATFDDNLSTETGVSEATNLFPHSVGENDGSESDEDEEVALYIENFPQALDVLSDPKKFAVQRNCANLLQPHPHGHCCCIGGATGKCKHAVAVLRTLMT